MQTHLEHILTSCYKEAMISYLTSHPEDFEQAIKLALSDIKPYSWRAAWLLWSCMNDNDARLKPYIKKIVDVIPSVSDGQMRELLIILQKMDLPRDCEGRLFDICTDIWTTPYKQPSVRISALKILIKIARKHPELQKEIDLLTQGEYIEKLSEALKRTIQRLIKNFEKY